MSNRTKIYICPTNDSILANAEGVTSDYTSKECNRGKYKETANVRRGFVVQELLKSKLGPNVIDLGKSRSADFIVDGIRIECKGVSTNKNFSAKIISNIHNYFVNVSPEGMDRLKHFNPIVVFGMINADNTEVAYVGWRTGIQLSNVMKLVKKGECQALHLKPLGWDTYSCRVADLQPIDILFKENFELTPMFKSLGGNSV